MPAARNQRRVFALSVCLGALWLSGCDASCPDGYREDNARCVPAMRVDGAETADASTPVDHDRDDGSDHAPDPPKERDAGAPAGGAHAGRGGAAGLRGGEGGDAAEPNGTGAAGDAAPREEPSGAGGGKAGDDRGAAATGGMPAAGGGGAAAPGQSQPSGGDQSEAPAMPQAPVVGDHLLFWGNAAVTYPFVGDALIRSERLREAKYLVTGKLSLRNPSETALDVTCNVTLDRCINIERVSVAPASAVSLVMMCVGSTGPTADLQHATLTCTCASGAACNGLGFESLGILARVIAADSGTVQKPSAPTD